MEEERPLVERNKSSLEHYTEKYLNLVMSILRIISSYILIFSHILIMLNNRLAESFICQKVYQFIKNPTVTYINCQARRDQLRIIVL